MSEGRSNDPKRRRKRPEEAGTAGKSGKSGKSGKGGSRTKKTEKAPSSRAKGSGKAGKSTGTASGKSGKGRASAGSARSRADVIEQVQEPPEAVDAGAGRVPVKTSGPRVWFDERAPELKGFALMPLALLFLLNFFDEFDQFAFGVLTPEIQDAFDLSDTGIGVIRGLAGGLVWFAAPFLGFLGDRMNRVRLSIGGAVVWGVMAVASGVIPGTMVWLFGIVRFGSGAGKTVNEPIHTSLLSDFYPPRARGRVFSIHRSANALGAMAAPGLAGLIAVLLDWRAAFIIMGIPTIILVFFALRLKEPVRGEMEDREAAIEASKEDPVPFGRAVRWLYSVPTMKRIYIGAFFGGFGGISFATFAAIFLEDEFGLDPFQRGMLLSAGGVTGLAGFVFSGWLTDKLQREKTLAHVGVLYGSQVALIGFFLLFYAASPTLWMVVPFSLLVGFFVASWLPPYLTIIGYCSPPRIRSLGYSYASFFYAAGTISVIITGSISDIHGIRWALGFAATALFVGGLILGSSAKFVNADAARAAKVLQTEATLRAERLEAGANSLLVIRELDVAYGSTQVLFDVNLDVKEGELVALLGTNGAGKSTLLKAISGLVHPMGGAIYFDGKDITHFEPEETAEAGIIQMPGGKAIFPTLTVEENLELASWLYVQDADYIRRARARALEIFPILGERMGQQAGSLSGGEQQMLSLAQAFIAKPRLLMIDELSLGLAPLIVQQLLRIVEEIHEQGTTIILVEQSVNVALTVAKHAYFMEKGEIRFDGPTEDLLGREDILRSVFLEGAGSVVGDDEEERE